MHILVINCGSSSVKIAVLNPKTGKRAICALIDRINTPSCKLSLDGQQSPLANADHAAALILALPKLIKLAPPINAVGHRVVHGGSTFTKAQRIDQDVIKAIEELIPLAPLHLPANLIGLRVALEQLPEVPHIAVFDTAFHATLPRRSRTYALPKAIAEKYGYRRYGFHGPSHQWVAGRVADQMGEDIRDLRIITCHLGGGCSVTAIEYGRSVETSMGMTPLEGLVMGTRSGDIDAGVLIDLMRREGLTVDQLDSLLNRESGLSGLSDNGSDMRDIEEKAANGDDSARLAIYVFCHRLRKYIGAYAAVMGGVDAIAFTGGIGENSALIRHRVAQRLEFLGARISEDRNRDARVDASHPVAEISQDRGRTRLYAVATDEEWSIAKSAALLTDNADHVRPQRGIPIAVSARHIHLTQEAVEALFGPGHQLTPFRPLSQPGQYAAEEKLTLIGPKRQLEGVRILGPVRSACQVEISRTDEFFLGVDAPVRDSGDVRDTPGITLKGPAGTLSLNDGLICARRHIHMHPDDAQAYGVSDRDVVEIAVNSDGRDLIFGDVLIRVKSSYALEMHIDTDEANAAQIIPGQIGALQGTGRVGTLRHRRTRYDRYGE